VVNTEGLLNITPFVAAKSMVAPATEALPLVKAKTVKVTKDFPSASKVVELALILIEATLAFTTIGGVIGVVGVVGVTGGAGAVALPPPPPQAQSAATRQKPIKYFKTFMLIFPKLIAEKKTNARPRARPPLWA
jgi:hypothetical protein